jgi:NADPH-dependent curcumin reductase CurA
MKKNRQVLLASRPQGRVVPGNFRIVDTDVPAPGEGEVLVRNEWLSLDPYMRGRMNDVKSYAPSVAIGGVMVGQTAGEVVESRDERLEPGTKVLTQLGWQLYGVVRGKDVTPIDAARAPMSYYLGLLGMPGFTAWFGVNEVGKPKAGETFVVSAASGAVGSVAGQLAKLAGCRVVGIAGGREKCDYVTGELGFDACVDHRSATFAADLGAACPKGIDVDFENAGGPVLDAALACMNPFSRIIVCGFVAETSASEPYGQKRMRSILVNRIRMQGILVFDWKDRYGEALEGLSRLVAEASSGIASPSSKGWTARPRASSRCWPAATSASNWSSCR